MSGYSYIQSASLDALLAAGVPLQQWLGVRTANGFRFIHWIAIEKTGESTWTVFDKDSLDQGASGHRDLTEFFNDSDPDFPEGVGYDFGTINEALGKSEALGGSRDKFVRFCEIQLVYDSFVAQHGHLSRDSSEYFSPQS